MIFISYTQSPKCKNNETYGELCVKCEKCGRKFDEYGFLIKDIDKKKVKKQGELIKNEKEN